MSWWRRGSYATTLPLSVFLSLCPSLSLSLGHSRSRSIDCSRSQSHFFSLPPILLICCSHTLSFHPLSLFSLSLTTCSLVPLLISLILLSISLPHDIFFYLSKIYPILLLHSLWELIFLLQARLARVARRGEHLVRTSCATSAGIVAPAGLVPRGTQWCAEAGENACQLCVARLIL